MSTVKAVSEPEPERQSWVEINPADHSAQSDVTEPRGRATKQEIRSNIIRGRTKKTKKLTLCLSISHSHLRPFNSGMCPICFLSMSRDRRGRNKTAERRDKAGGEREDPRWGPTRRKEGRDRDKRAEVNWRENKETGETVWWFPMAVRGIWLMTSPLCEHAQSKTCRWDCLFTSCRNAHTPYQANTGDGPQT